MITRAQVRQFLAVVDGGSFTRAAELINVTQPTLSTGVAELEKQLGAKLIVREKRRIQLTEVGTRFLIHARKIQREFRLAEDETIVSKPQLEPIKLGVLESISTSLIEPFVSEYQLANGENPLSIQEGKESEIAGALAKNRIDLALTILRQYDEDTNSKLLLEEPYLLMVSNQHRIAEKQIVSPEEISNETMIARRSCEILPETSKFFTAHGARPPFSLRSPHEDRVMAMVRAGLGITVAPQSHRVTGVTAIQIEGFSHTRKIGIMFGDNWLGKVGTNHLVRIISESI